jgi:MFS family permease
VTVVCVMPLFLVGAMAVQISTELALGTSALGLAIGVSRGSGATASAALGRLADRIGAVWSVRMALGIAAVSSWGIFSTVVGVKSLIAWLVVAGWANALGQPAVNRLLARVVQPDRLGLAFGVKQSAPPAALMLAGLCVPLVAATLGWRWGFATVVMAAAAVFLMVGQRPALAQRRPHEALPARVSFRETWLFSVAFALGTAASSAGTAFYVHWAAALGSNPSAAGIVLAVASLAAICARLLSGWASDRMGGGHLRVCAGMLVVGCLGFALLASGSARLGSIGIVIALTGAWGFNGVFWFALVRAYASAPGAITGALAPGGLVGAAAGPIVFGVLADEVGYAASWSAAALMSLAAAGAMVLGGRRL